MSPIETHFSKLAMVTRWCAW